MTTKNPLLESAGADTETENTLSISAPFSIVNHLPLNTAIGPPELCAWQPVRGIVWVQCRTPEHANRLAKRSDSRLVVRGMAGGYLKTYEFHRPLSWAARLIRRYTRQRHAANARLNPPIPPAGAFSSETSIGRAEARP